MCTVFAIQSTAVHAGHEHVKLTYRADESKCCDEFASFDLLYIIKATCAVLVASFLS